MNNITKVINFARRFGPDYRIVADSGISLLIYREIEKEVKCQEVSYSMIYYTDNDKLELTIKKELSNRDIYDFYSNYLFRIEEAISQIEEAGYKPNVIIFDSRLNLPIIDKLFELPVKYKKQSAEWEIHSK